MKEISLNELIKAGVSVKLEINGVKYIPISAGQKERKRNSPLETLDEIVSKRHQ